MLTQALCVLHWFIAVGGKYGYEIFGCNDARLFWPIHATADVKVDVDVAFYGKILSHHDLFWDEGVMEPKIFVVGHWCVKVNLFMSKPR